MGGKDVSRSEVDQVYLNLSRILQQAECNFQGGLPTHHASLTMKFLPRRNVLLICSHLICRLLSVSNCMPKALKIYPIIHHSSHKTEKATRCNRQHLQFLRTLVGHSAAGAAHHVRHMQFYCRRNVCKPRRPVKNFLDTADLSKAVSPRLDRTRM